MNLFTEKKKLHFPCDIHVNWLETGCVNEWRGEKRLIPFNVKWEKPLSLSRCQPRLDILGVLISHRRDPKTKIKETTFLSNWKKTSFLFTGQTQSISIRLPTLARHPREHSLGLRKLLLKMSSWCEPLINQDLNDERGGKKVFGFLKYRETMAISWALICKWGLIRASLFSSPFTPSSSGICLEIFLNKQKSRWNIKHSWLNGRTYEAVNSDPSFEFLV